MSEDQLTPSVTEAVEAAVMHQFVSNASPPVRSALGIATTRIGGGVVLSVREDVTRFWNKALGFGFAEPVTADLVDRVLDFYRGEGNPGAVIQIAPSVLPADWAEICAAREIEAGPVIVKLACRIEDFRPGGTRLRVGPVEADDVLEMATSVLRGSGLPTDGYAEMVAAGVRASARPFAVWDGGEMVAAATLFVQGEIGSLNAAATLPGHRNRGAQSALLAARAREAANAGCRWLVAEAEVPAEGGSNPSLNNMQRAGLRPLYHRRNWLWRPAAAAVA